MRVFCSALAWLAAEPDFIFNCLCFLALAVLSRDFVARFGDSTLTCPADDLNTKAKVMLKDLCDRYNINFLPIISDNG